MIIFAIAMISISVGKMKRLKGSEKDNPNFSYGAHYGIIIIFTLVMAIYIPMLMDAIALWIMTNTW